MPRPIVRPFLSAALGVATVALAAAVLYLYVSAPSAEELGATAAPAVAAAAPSAPAPARAAEKPLVQGLPDFRALVRAYGPAVVNISVKGQLRAATPGADPESMPDDPIHRYFRGPPGGDGPMPRRGEGSGFIVASDGVVLTNAHVVADAREVTVKLSDRREYSAKVLGADEQTDVAVLRIEAQGLPTVRIGDPRRVEPGEWVVAIGAPFGFDNSVTAGIVSAKGRSLPDDTYVPFIQTDVAINPGNSGGPLFNLAGEVVGMNSQIYSRSGGYQGISFAIPIDVAMNVSRQLQAEGRVRRGRLGIGIQEVDQALAETFGLDRPRGALVSSVEPGSAAERAGLREGDVILGFNGSGVATAAELPALVAVIRPGTRAALEFWRERALQRAEIVVGEFPQRGAVAAVEREDGQGRLGLGLRPLSPREVEMAKVPGGLLVEQASGAAAEAGIRPGDIVLSANGKAVREVGDLRSIVAAGGRNVALLVQRGTARIFVPVRVG